MPRADELVRRSLVRSSLSFPVGPRAQVKVASFAATPLLSGQLELASLGRPL